MKLLALFILLNFSLTLAHADIYRGPVATALGGAGSAGLNAAESSMLNPALIPLFQGSSLDASFRDGYTGPGQHRQGWSLGAVDNTRDVWFPGSLHYVRTRDTGRAATPVNGEMWHAAVSEQFEDLSVGLSVMMLNYDVEKDRKYTQWNGSIGVAYTFQERYGVAYVLRNLMKVADDVPAGLREDMQQTIGGYAAFAEMAKLVVDITRRERFNPGHNLTFAVGMESKLSDTFLLRLGHRSDAWADQKYWTAGLSFDGPRLKVDYALEKNQEATPGALHSVDLRLVF